jgi:hypothetical protein
MVEHDPTDAWVIQQVRAALDETDPVPPEVLEAARASLTWLTVDAELAMLAEDSAAFAGVRSTVEAPRILNFECATGAVVLEVTRRGDLRRLLGHTDRVAHVEIRHSAGAIEIDTDEHGRFRVDEVPAGPISVRCVFADSPDAPIVTSWVVV